MNKIKRTLLFLIIIALITSLFPATVYAAETSLSEDKPTITIVNKGPKAVNIKWDSISGAKGYKVYRATSKNGSYKKIATVTKNKYVDTKVKRNNTYYYKLLAYAGKTSGTLSSAKKIKASFDKPVLTLASSSTSSISFKWSKIYNASGYQVYYATSKNGKFTKIKDVKKPSIKHSKLTKNKAYFYKVRAYTKIKGKTFYSPYSTVTKYTTPKTNEPAIADLYSIRKISQEYKTNDYGQATVLLVEWEAISKTTGNTEVLEVIRLGKNGLYRDQRSRTLSFTSKDKGSDGSYHITLYTTILRDNSVYTSDQYEYLIRSDQVVPYVTLYEETERRLKFASYYQ